MFSSTSLRCVYNMWPVNRNLHSCLCVYYPLPRLLAVALMLMCSKRGKRVDLLTGPSGIFSETIHVCANVSGAMVFDNELASRYYQYSRIHISTLSRQGGPVNQTLRRRLYSCLLCKPRAAIFASGQFNKVLFGLFSLLNKGSGVPSPSSPDDLSHLLRKRASSNTRVL